MTEQQKTSDGKVIQPFDKTEAFKKIDALMNQVMDIAKENELSFHTSICYAMTEEKGFECATYSAWMGQESGPPELYFSQLFMNEGMQAAQRGLMQFNLARFSDLLGMVQASSEADEATKQ